MDRLMKVIGRGTQGGMSAWVDVMVDKWNKGLDG